MNCGDMCCFQSEMCSIWKLVACTSCFLLNKEHRCIGCRGICQYYLVVTCACFTHQARNLHVSSSSSSSSSSSILVVPKPKWHVATDSYKQSFSFLCRLETSKTCLAVECQLLVSGSVAGCLQKISNTLADGSTRQLYHTGHARINPSIKVAG